MACEFDALTDLEELQIEKSPRLQIRLELQINFDGVSRALLNPEPKTPDPIWSCNRTPLQLPVV